MVTRLLMKKFCLLLLFFFPALHAAPVPPPPANEVFSLNVKVLDPNSLAITWHIKKGFFLYQDRIKLTKLQNNHFHMGRIIFPKSQQHTDTQGHQFNVYYNSLILPIPILGETPGEGLLTVRYQGCSEAGFCYPPQTQTIQLTIDTTLALKIATLESAPLPPPIPPENSIESIFATHHWLMILLTFFGLGLLLSFTPCILPMIPVLSGIIVGHGPTLTTRKAFFLSLTYVLSMAFTYALIGGVIALMGSNLQVIMQSPWMIAFLSGIFFLLSLSMFDVYELKLPTTWQAALAKITRHQQSGHYLGTAIMGSLSTLILSPCVTAPLLGVLGYIAKTGNVPLGCLTLFFLGLGMGTPLLLIGTSAGKLLPKAGQWMNLVKFFFGILLLGVAIYLLQRIIPILVTMWLWAGLFIFTGLLFGTFNKSTTKLVRCWWQSMGALSFIYGLLILIGASAGGDNPLKPLAAFHKTSTVIIPMTTVTTLKEAQAALEDAIGQPVMLDFYADWCESCKIIEHTTLQDPNIITTLQQFRVIKIDLSANNADSGALLHYFKIVAPPMFLFFDRTGKALPELTLGGEISGKILLTQLQAVMNTVPP